ncbi:hypothetical protein [Thalassomonas sp. M1454]|uniref:hypothetical protein n=1 Tax=Thalassomonas sp. M1454 TaxID=2594477 RepID=UPI00117FF846|nr:hypothetical protein [Thalassomonas sp. M1454]TRX57174.1 hypothetical protein FNN08_06660 [Thalassomonas sp. M1454]
MNSNSYCCNTEDTANTQCLDNRNINLQMNHHNFGQTPLRPYALHSINQLNPHQQKALEHIAHQFKLADDAFEKAITKILSIRG